MEKPTIELKAVKLHQGLSQETPAYTAKVYVDGKHFADVSNDGHGGCDYVHPAEGVTHEDVRELNERIAATYPPIESEVGDLKQDLELLCHTLAWEDVDKKSFRRKFNTKLLSIEDGNVYAYKVKPTAEAMARFKAQKPHATILQNHPFDDAFRMARDLGAA